MPKDVLVAVVGESPAVVTETLWAAAFGPDRDPDQPFAPAEIHLVVTARAKRAVDDRLLGPDGGLDRYRKIWAPNTPTPNLVAIQLGGNAIDDVTTKAESEALGDTLVALLARLTSDPETRVYASMAGGRKTMGACTSLVISCLGRVQDRLSHVLLEEPDFERCDDFWFPLPADRFPDPEDRLVGFVDPFGRMRTLDSAVAAEKLRLCDLPFPRLRYLVSEAELARLVGLGFTGIAEGLDEAARPLNCTLDASARTLQVGARAPHRLDHLQFAFVWTLARAAAEQWRGAGPAGHGPEHAGWLSVVDWTDPDSPAITEFVRIYAHSRRPADDPKADPDDYVIGWQNAVKALRHSLAEPNVDEAQRDGRSLPNAIQAERLKRDARRQFYRDNIEKVKGKAVRSVRQILRDPVLSARLSIVTEEDPPPARSGFLPGAIEFTFQET